MNYPPVIPMNSASPSTPQKPSEAKPSDVINDNPMQTPESLSTTNGESEECHMLLETFSGLKINNTAGTLKRSADLMTIEGTPMNITKRVDLNSTPTANYVLTADLLDSFSACTAVNDDVALNISKLDAATKAVATTSVTQRPAYLRKVLIINSSTDDHDTGNHQENFLRTKLLCGADGCLRRSLLNDFVVWVPEQDVMPAPISDLLRVHEYSYLSHLQSKCLQSSAMAASDGTAEEKDSGGAMRMQPMPSFYAPAGNLDTDTPLVTQSLNASRKYCGAAMLAVDYLMRGRSTSQSSSASVSECLSHAFVLGRPPGHHAGSRGCVPSDYHWKRPDMTSSGFCLLNTVAVAAAYALYRYGRDAVADNRSDFTSDSSSSSGDGSAHGRRHAGAFRIAIVDIDIHHGNGTEEIVRNLRPHTTFLPLPSSWAPVSSISYKPWLDDTDPENVLFSSINLFQEDRFYPCSGGDYDETAGPAAQLGPSSSSSSSIASVSASASEGAGTAPSRGSNIINIGLSPVGPGPSDPRARAKLTPIQRAEYCAIASKEMRQKTSAQLLPRLQAFCPDMLFISAGFDAHHNDMYHFLDEADFHWLTEQLCLTVAPWGGKVISVLEGGYSLSSPLTPAAKPLSARQTVIAQAKAHAHAGSKVEAPMSLRTRPADQRELPLSDTLTAAVAKNAKQSRGKSKKQTEISDGSQAGSSSMSAIEALRSSLDVDKPIAATLDDVGEKVPASVIGPVSVISVSPLPFSLSLSFTTKEQEHQHQNQHQLQQHLGTDPSSARDHDHDHRPDHVASVPSDQSDPLTDTVTTATATASASASATAAIVSTSRTDDLSTVHVSNASSSQRVYLAASYTYSQESRTMFAQENGDGGLVKGVLAHVAALAGLKAWVRIPAPSS